VLKAGLNRESPLRIAAAFSDRSLLSPLASSLQTAFFAENRCFQPFRPGGICGSPPLDSQITGVSLFHQFP
jgi:hypothetical protein